MRHVVFMSALLGLSLIHCSSKDNKGPKYPDASSFCAALGRAECGDKVVTACNASSKDACASHRQDVCKSTYVTPATAKGLTYDAAQAETCVNAVSSAYNDAVISGDDAQSISKACSAVFSKQGAKGASCASDLDCKRSDGLQCVIHVAAQANADAGEPEGTCQVPRPQPGGNLCTAPDATCVTGYHCSSDSHCLQDEPMGSNCSAVDPCLAELLCTAGTCVDKLANRTACTSDDECLNGICLQGTDGSQQCASSQILAPSEPFCVQVNQ